MPIVIPTPCFKLTRTKFTRKSIIKTNKVELLIIVCTIDNGSMNCDAPTQIDAMEMIIERINSNVKVLGDLKVMSDEVSIQIR